MIEQGIAQMVQADARVSGIALLGGFLATLPKGQALPSWTYATVSNTALAPSTTSFQGLRRWHAQIDCYGLAAADVINLGKAITQALNGYRGTLPDPEATPVDSVFLLEVHDPEWDEASRTWRRVLEFEVNYQSVL